MKYSLLLLLFVSTKIIAQNEPRIETPFNSFTKLPSVEWAISANDTLICLQPNIRTELINKMKANKILSKFNVWDDSKEELDVTQSKLSEICKMLNGYDFELPIYNETGNVIQVKKREIEKDIADGLLKIHQKLYIENGKLNSYISYVSPIKKVVSAQGVYLGNSEVFATAFNKKYNYSPSPKDKIIFLTKTERELFVDSIKKENKNRETFGRNMVETLWPYVLANKLKVYSVATGKLLNVKEINSEFIGNPSIIVPMYDSVGNVTSKKIDKYPLMPSIFTKVIINQMWYYNDTKNIFFNKIPHIILYSKFVGEEELKPILKISFTK